jgi:hypothetical protein
VARLLRKHFVCIALDNVNHPQLTPGERAFVKDKGLKACTWGMSTFTAGGKVLEMGGSFEAKGVVPMLERALGQYTPEDNVEIPQPTPGELAKLKQPPEGGLVCYVTWQVLGKYKAEGSPTTGDDLYKDLYQKSLGVDRLWVRMDEADALAGGEFPESLQKRLWPHVSYIVAGDVKSMELTVTGGRLAGSFRTTGDGRGDLLGYVETKDGRVTRFDLLVKGMGEQLIDCGFSASLHVIPKGRKLPVAMLFTLADPADELARVVPLAANDENYLK